MFTGIVRHVGAVTAVAPTGGGKRLVIDLGPLTEDLRAGDSVAVNGACLTAVDITQHTAAFDVISETLEKTTLGNLRAGSRVNLERAMTLGETLDGHLVQGHVDGTAVVKNIRTGDQHVIEFSAGADLTGQMVPKGSVCITGVSLTLVNVDRDRFSVALIPTTLGETTLGSLKIGDTVNIETDVIGKYVLKYLLALGGSAGSGGGLSLEKLKNAGF